ncbi:hypothetical protein [Streptomyces sp. NPDC060194]|uniref:hypothetical protein n=1 Tax=Streptomyces sp. NPDC060194 TaxID=3347069 RepID=UPI0036676B80
MSRDYRTGDVLSLECPFAATVVTGVSRRYVTVRCPWLVADTDAAQMQWSGERALPMPSSREWDLFVTDPAADTLRIGDGCRLGIRRTTVHVQGVHRFDPPLVTGMLPRPALLLALLRQGEAHDPALEEQGCTIDPDGAEPVRIGLVFRPYAFLEPGDEVADGDGRAWRFEGAWDWHPFDGTRSTSPTWPLTLLTRRGEPAPEAPEGVALATAHGSHAAERDRWTALTHVLPAGAGLR